ncbi:MULTISPECIES: RNA-guided endonuclease TnpB family protein [unclassified Massilia]|uniref:RNA-guided endonuclease InsQ/TnpB family protein n=1 Tax=unclassified Massilia TaxID=2609279 RepID=UPI0017816575|nr:MULTISPECIES: RNA-guided endonuclease TnpB family protein [unclassified Massilia]MBD8532555.1 transposase [Massilia sp. CFBP 13647]MBD8672955.1 transposase [Massilia sp. CFBP 13721]
MILAHRIRLDPNKVQATHLARAAGTARFAYNWSLAQWQRQFEACKADPALPKPNEAALRRQLNAIKRGQFPWMLEVTKNAPQMAIIQLGRAFQNFFEKRARYPKFRRKGIDDRFTLTNDQFRVDGKRIRIPKLGWLRMRETLRFTGRIVSASVSQRAGHWYASITVDTQDAQLPPAENQGAVGVDFGVTHLATLSTGEKVADPKALHTLLDRLRRLSRSLSRKVKGSCNRKKAKARLARLHARIVNVRANGLHKLSASIVRRFHTIGIEDLHVKGMLGNRCLSRAIADMGFAELRRQRVYKTQRRGGQVVVIDRWYPSSKTCSCCRHKLDALDLAIRQWTCPACGALHDRDINAAINLRTMAVSSTVSACGGEGAGPVREAQDETGPGEAGIQRKVNDA